MKVYKPVITYTYEEDIINIKTKEKARLYEVLFDTDLFSSKKKVLKVMKKELKSLKKEKDLIIASIEIKVIKLNKSIQKTIIFNKNLKEIGWYDFENDFINSSESNPNDFVLYRDYNCIRIGRIAASALKDEPNLVIYENTNINDCSPHSHVCDYDIIQFISEEKAKELLPRKFYENINNRCQNHWIKGWKR